MGNTSNGFDLSGKWSNFGGINSKIELKWDWKKSILETIGARDV